MLSNTKGESIWDFDRYLVGSISISAASCGFLYQCVLLQANATGRSAKTVREFLEKYYTEELVSSEKGTVKLAIRALLEVVQSGRKNLEIAVMRRGEPMQVCLNVRPVLE